MKNYKLTVFGDSTTNTITNDNYDKGSFHIIEKNVIKKSFFNNTLYNIELSNLFFENRDTSKQNNNKNHSLDFNKPSVIINTNIFSCELEKIDSANICLSLSDCNGDENCNQIEESSNLTIMGKEPIYSFVASENNIHTKYVKLKPGEYEIIPNKNDVLSSNYCNKIELDGLNFNEFTMGVSMSENNKSLLCINISDGCYGMIKNGETKICDINKVFIKNLM